MIFNYKCSQVFKNVNVVRMLKIARRTRNLVKSGEVHFQLISSQCLCLFVSHFYP